jgi:hypothetical protein
MLGRLSSLRYCGGVERTIEKEGPVFWQTLQDNLSAAMDLLPEEVIGSMTTFAGGIRVNLNRLGMAFNQSYTDLFYKRGASEIRCSMLNGSPYTLTFCVIPDNKVGVKSTLGPDTMDPGQVSAHVIQLMLDRIERK